MATNYPSGLDTYTNPAGTDALSTGHASQHANVNDAVEAIEAELGTNPSGSQATVKARIEAIETNDWVTTARIANSQVTSAKIADATITGSDIASETITSANITDGTIVNADLSATAAVDPSKIAQNRVTFSNANASCASSTRRLAQVGSMSASRTVTLPAANSVDAGTEIVVCDESGTVTATNTIVIQRAGSDTVNGTTSVAIGAAYGMRRLISDGTSKWSVDGGVVRLSDVGTITSTMIADATITGTDIASGTVTSTNILDDTIVNADINASAAIVGTKLADGAITPIKTSGGYVAKTALYTATNDDRVIDCTSGTYTITLPTAASQTGRTFIIRNSGSGTITIGRTGAETISGATSQTLAGYGSLDVISNGTNWLVLRGTYTDETVGRRIFTWDTVNSRWQMTYGDTGLRSLTLTPNAPCSTLTVELRRVNNLCHIDVVWVNGAITLPQADFSLSDTALPSGFTPTRIMRGISWSNYLGNAAGVIYLSTLTLKSSAAAGSMAAGGGSTQQRAWTYSTTDAWPTSLPGAAVGSIPAT